MSREILLKGIPTKTTTEDDSFLAQIEKNNQTHVVNEQELQTLISKASHIHKQHFDDKVYLERSIFTNWTCGIADCKYCYLSTKPKLDRTAVRSPESILAEALICKAMGWKVGYITGGLRVEKTEYMVDLLQKLEYVLGHKTMMNYGPYTKQEVDSFAPFVTGMGCAVESFDEKLHAYICPSKPLKVLLKFLGFVKEKKLESFITIILGIGEKMSDIDEVIKKVEEYNITKVQLCFLKAQEQTVFDQTAPPDMNYMAWWTARLRIAHPKLIIKIALVKGRIDDLHMLLNAGVNSITRYMIFDDFAGELAIKLQKECELAGRKLQGNFTYLPQLDLSKMVNDIPAIEPELKRKILIKANQYYLRLAKLKEKKPNAVVDNEYD